jgi:hypothetical protein
MAIQKKVKDGIRPYLPVANIILNARCQQNEQGDAEDFKMMGRK